MPDGVTIPQPRKGNRYQDVPAAVVGRRKGADKPCRFMLTLPPAICEAIGWHEGIRLGLRRLDDGAFVASPDSYGRVLRRVIPTTKRLTVHLAMPEHITAVWRPLLPVEHRLLPHSRAFEFRLPWPDVA